MKDEATLSNKPLPSATKKTSLPTGTGDGFDPETEKPWGVDPDTDELLTVLPGGLKVLFGLSAEKADELYCKIAGIDHGAVFFNPANEAKDYRPPINISNLKGKQREKVDKILGEVK